MPGKKRAYSFFKQVSFRWTFEGISCMVAALFLLFPLGASAQLSGPENQLTKVLSKALFTLQDVQQRQQKLMALPGALQDSISLNAALNKLKEKALPQSALVQKADSLRRAFAAFQNKLSKLQTREQQLLTQIRDLEQKVPAALLPPEARQMLGQLKPLSNLLPREVPVFNNGSNPIALPSAQLPAIQNILPKGNLASPVKQVTEGPVDYFAGHEKALNEARQELRKYSSRLDEIKNIKDVEKGYWQLNALKGKPWPERVVVGSLWQFRYQEQYHIDLGPSLAWRLTDLFLLGGGFQYRLSVSTKHRPLINSADRVYGYYGFFDAQIKKGFFGRLQYDDWRTGVRTSPEDEMTRAWVKGLSLGLGRTYQFYRKINGYALLQYNVLHRHGQTPYLRPLQARLGFYINGGELVKRK